MPERQPRLGEHPPPGHWAAGLPAFRGAAYLSHGLDCLAEQAGMPDGLTLLLKTCGVAMSDVEHAEPAQAREWFYACYARYGEKTTGAWDVVAAGCGIYSFGSGWAPPRLPLITV